jgi:phosphate butyryltransferase
LNTDLEELVIQTFDQLLAFAATLPPKRVAVALPSSPDTFDALRDAVLALNISLVCAGDDDLIRRELSSRGVDAGRVSVVPADGTRRALRAAIDAVRQGEADILMKGSVDTATMMREVLDA